MSASSLLVDLIAKSVTYFVSEGKNYLQICKLFLQPNLYGDIFSIYFITPTNITEDLYKNYPEVEVSYASSLNFLHTSELVLHQDGVINHFKFVTLR